MSTGASQMDPAAFLSIFEQAPIPLSIYDHTGLQVAMNQANAALFNLRPDEWVGHFNMITNAELAAGGSAERHRRVMQGETIVVPPHPFTASQSGMASGADTQLWIEATYAPLRGADGAVTHLIAILRDVTTELRQSQEIAAARLEIASQQAVIDSLSTPVVTVWEGILAVPLVGTIDSHRASSVTEDLLSAITDRQAGSVIIDITGVPMVDTQVAQYLIRTAQACKLLGCNVALVGIGVEMAQTLVQLGVDLSTLTTLANLQAGIAWAFTQHGMRVSRSPAPAARA